MNTTQPQQKRIRHYPGLVILCALILPLTIVFGPSALHAAAVPDGKAAIQEAYGKLPLIFEANQGQTDRQVKFLSRGSGYTLFLTPSEAVLALKQPKTEAKVEAQKEAVTTSNSEPRTSNTVLRMRLVGANPKPKMAGLEELPGKSNYFIGNDPKKWRANIANYAKVRYRNIYPGVDLVYYGNQQQLEYDFVVSPGADPGRIALRFQGADRLEVDTQGNLVLHTGLGEIHQRKPAVYQEVAGARHEISGGYVLLDIHTVGFRLGAYDDSRPLIIDPVLFYSTYLGGNYYDFGYDIAVDGSGNAYVTGYTVSSNFPTTGGAFQTTFGGNVDAFVTKLNPTGSGLVYL